MRVESPHIFSFLLQRPCSFFFARGTLYLFCFSAWPPCVFVFGCKVRGFSQRAPLLLEALTKELRDLGPNLLESQGFCSKEGGQGGVAAHFETVQEQLVRGAL